MKTLLIGIIFLFTLSSFAKCEGLGFIQSSDQHSAYNNLERLFMYSKVYLKDCIDKHIALSGDLGGASEYALKDDQGIFMFKSMTTFFPDGGVSLTKGNHDGVDFDYGDPMDYPDGKPINTLLNQTEIFMEMNNGRGYLAANARPKDKRFKKVVQPYNDVFLDSTKKSKVRIVGLVFDNFTDFINAKYPDFVGDTIPMLEEAKEQLLKAAKDKSIKRVVFSCHEFVDKVEEFSRLLHEWKAQHPKLAHIKTDLVFAAHDHKTKMITPSESGSAYIIDNGSKMDSITTFSLGSEGEFTDKPKQIIFKEISKQEQERVMAHGQRLLTNKEKIAIEVVRELVERAEKENATVVAKYIPNIPFTRADLKLGKNPLGYALGDALAIGAMAKARVRKLEKLFTSEEFIKEHGTELGPKIIKDYLSNNKAAFGFFNSGSYRLGPLGNSESNFVELTKGNLKGMFPFADKVTDRFILGKDFLTFFKDVIKLHIENGAEYIPQTSSNLKLTVFGDKGRVSFDPTNPAHDIEYASLLEFDGVRWEPLVDKKYYLISLGPWLSINGWGIRSWDKILPETIRLYDENRELRSLMQAHLPDRFKKWLSLEVLKLFEVDHTCDTLFKARPDLILLNR